MNSYKITPDLDSNPPSACCSVHQHIKNSFHPSIYFPPPKMGSSNLLSLLTCTLALCICGVTSQASRLSNRPIVLVVSFDGFRHSYMTPTNTPLLTNLSLTGATTPYMIPAFPTKTFPNHQSIATGLYTESHGIVDNEVFDDLYEKKLYGKSNDPGFWNYDERVLPLWIRNQQQGGYSGCLMWPGSSQGYGKNSDLKPTHYYNGYNEGVTWESRVSTVIGWMTHAQQPANLVYLYYHEPDSAGHSKGPYASSTIQQVKDTDKRVGYLIDQLRAKGIYDRVNLVLLSDHGMKTVFSDKYIDLSQYVDRNTLVRDVNGDSPVIQVIPRAGKRPDLYNALKSGSGQNGHFQVFKKEELCGEPYYYCNARRVHEFVTLAEPGWTIKNLLSRNKRAVRNKRGTEYGSHGYINTSEAMRVFFIAKGPAFKTGYKTSAPIKNVDVVPLISKVLGLTNVPTNGTLSRVQGMLK